MIRPKVDEDTDKGELGDEFPCPYKTPADFKVFSDCEKFPLCFPKYKELSDAFGRRAAEEKDMLENDNDACSDDKLL